MCGGVVWQIRDLNCSFLGKFVTFNNHQEKLEPAYNLQQKEHPMNQTTIPQSHRIHGNWYIYLYTPKN